MSKTFTVTDEMRDRQMGRAAKVMGDYVDYAKRIGCTIQGDSIACTAKQSKLLKAWWERNAK